MNPVLAFALGELFVVAGIVFILTRPGNVSDEHSRMISFGSVILTGIGLVFALAMAMYYFETPVKDIESRGKDIFENCTTVLPPIVTLILGYYFGKKDK